MTRLDRAALELAMEMARKDRAEQLEDMLAHGHRTRWALLLTYSAACSGGDVDISYL